jgi:tRNA nucleotidyltransferase/poly(A) polymerase
MMCKLTRDTVEDILREGRIYEVGGAVRDSLLKRGKVKDRDYLVTGIPYDNLTRILKNHGRVDLVGKSFGVIKFTQLIRGAPFTFDIALPRREHSTGAGHKDFAVDFDPFLNVEEDLVRRDFTVNAMALSLDNQELIDPLDGVVDLENRRLRMTSANSFVEDPLRMLRAVQLAARFQFVIEPETFESLRKQASLIRSVSSERIAEELNKLLVRASEPSEGFRLMQTTGLLKEILPELEECVGVEQPGGYHKYDVFEHTLHTVDAARPELRLRMAALFHDITKPAHRRLNGEGATFYGHEMSAARVARAVLSRLRYSNDFIKDVMTLVERHMFTTAVTDKGLRRLVRRVGVSLIFDLLDLRRADVQAQGMGGSTDDVDRFEAEIKQELSRKPPFGYSDLALDGHDIMEMLDLHPGRAVGIILDHLLETVLDHPEFNTKDKLTRIATEFYDKHKDSVSSANDKESY